MYIRFNREQLEAEEQRLQYHKGERCPYVPDVLCQEGYCSDCYLYRQVKAHSNFITSLFFIPEGVVFHTAIPPEVMVALIPAVPYAVCARRYDYGSHRLN